MPATILEIISRELPETKQQSAYTQAKALLSGKLIRGKRMADRSPLGR